MTNNAIAMINPIKPNIPTINQASVIALPLVEFPILLLLIFFYNFIKIQKNNMFSKYFYIFLNYIIMLCFKIFYICFQLLFNFLNCSIFRKHINGYLFMKSFFTLNIYCKYDLDHPYNIQKILTTIIFNLFSNITKIQDKVTSDIYYIYSSYVDESFGDNYIIYKSERGLVIKYILKYITKDKLEEIVENHIVNMIPPYYTSLISTVIKNI